MDEDTTGKERVAHLVRRRAPLRRENSESTSDTSRKMTPLALRGRLMPRRREGRPPPAAPPCIRPWFCLIRSCSLDQNRICFQLHYAD